MAESVCKISALELLPIYTRSFVAQILAQGKNLPPSIAAVCEVLNLILLGMGKGFGGDEDALIKELVAASHCGSQSV